MFCSQSKSFRCSWMWVALRPWWKVVWRLLFILALVSEVSWTLLLVTYQVWEMSVSSPAERVLWKQVYGKSQFQLKQLCKISLKITFLLFLSFLFIFFSFLHSPPFFFSFYLFLSLFLVWLASLKHMTLWLFTVQPGKWCHIMYFKKRYFDCLHGLSEEKGWIFSSLSILKKHTLHFAKFLMQARILRHSTEKAAKALFCRET